MIPPTKIHVATDFSPPANRALARATSLAVEFKSSLTLVHVIPETALETVGSAVLEQLTSTGYSTASLVSEALERLSRLAAGIERRHGIRCEARVDSGRPAQRVAALADDGADLLVVGARGAHGARRMLTGTTAQKLLGLSPCPVLLVRSAPSARYARVLAPVDFSPSSRAALEAIAGLLPSAEVHVVHAFEHPFEAMMRHAAVDDRVIRQYTEKRSTALWNQLHGWADAIAGDGRSVHLHVEHGYPNTVIERLTDELRADLVALAAHGKSEMERSFLGSVSLHTALLSHGDVLVLTGGRFEQRAAQFDERGAPPEPPRPSPRPD